MTRRGHEPPKIANPVSHYARSSNDDLLNRHRVARAVMKLRRARIFMRRHPLVVLEQTKVLDICRDAGRAEHVAARVNVEACSQRRCHPDRRD
jgi:hypothetical protein